MFTQVFLSQREEPPREFSLKLWTKKLLAESPPDLSPVAVKFFDALYLDRMKPGQKVVVCHNAPFKVVLPAFVAVYNHGCSPWEHFRQWVGFSVKSRVK